MPKKNRINYAKPVYVHRYLGFGKRRRPIYSIIQHGRLVRRSYRILMVDCTFKVSEAGRLRVLRDGRKNVHAFVVGRIVASAMGIDRHGADLPVRVSYNPYNDQTFMASTSGQWTKELARPVSSARTVLLNERGMSACYTD